MVLPIRDPGGVTGARLGVFIQGAVVEPLLMLSAGDRAVHHLVLVLLELMVRQTRQILNKPLQAC